MIAAVAVVWLVALGAGTPRPHTTPPSEAAPGCTSIVELLDAQYVMFEAFLENDTVRLAAGLEALGNLVGDVRDAAPVDIAADVDVWLANADQTLAAIAGIGDPAVVLATLSTMPPPPPEFTAAQQAVEAWARDRCGWNPPGAGPADCRVLDAGAAAAAAGLEIDTTQPEAVFDGGGPAFTTQACTYGGGTLAVTTFAFDDRDAAAELMIGMATSVGGGTVVAAELGGLPDTTVVIEFAAAVQVVAFDADVPFAITIAGVEPTAAVAGAEALWASLAERPPDASAAPESTP